MKHSKSQKTWIILLLLWIFLILLWGYVKAWKKSDIPNEPPLTRVPLAQVETSESTPEVTEKTLSMWVVELVVKNKENVGKFYRDIVGFDALSESGNTMNLWENGKTFLRLIEEKDYTVAPKSEAWLYHIAITHNSRKDLALRLKNILSKTPERYQWSADHTATEAFYFSDPEGNGLELYYDKPRNDWVWKDGKPVMGSTYIDTMDYITRYSEIPVGEWITTMGHVHLKVGNIPQAALFYRDVLLFEEMSNRGDALFISRDKYHHHLGMNTWESLWASKRTPKTYGLKSFEIHYHDQYLYEQVHENLRMYNIPSVQQRDNGIEVEDPWGNALVLVLEKS